MQIRITKDGWPAAGTYQYDCAVHGTMMTGRIVVR
jgi:plastocyanin